MAKLRRLDSKAALAQQRAEVRRGARGKAFVGEDRGSAAARAAEREKVHRMQEAQQRTQEERQARARQTENLWQATEESGHVHEPMVALIAELVADSLRLVRTLVALPFRMLAALRGHHPHTSRA